MNIKDIQVGDMVRFRQWEDMESEFGLNGLGSINCPFDFTLSMAYLCGKVYRVLGFEDSAIETKKLIILEDEYGEELSWSISEDMLEPDEQIELDPFDCNEINVLLGI